MERGGNVSCSKRNAIIRVPGKAQAIKPPKPKHSGMLVVQPEKHMHFELITFMTYVK